MPAWPVEFIQLYLEDACTGRAWVDSDVPETKAFISKLLKWTTVDHQSSVKSAHSSWNGRVGDRQSPQPQPHVKMAMSKRTSASDAESSGVSYTSMLRSMLDIFELTLFFEQVKRK